MFDTYDLISKNGLDNVQWARVKTLQANSDQRSLSCIL
jgi:hypothetical protein